MLNDLHVIVKIIFSKRHRKPNAVSLLDLYVFCLLTYSFTAGIIMLFFIAWPIAVFLAPFWILLQPFEAILPLFADINSFLERFVTCKLVALLNCFVLDIISVTCFGFEFNFSLTIANRQHVVLPAGPRALGSAIVDCSSTCPQP